MSLKVLYFLKLLKSECGIVRFRKYEQSGRIFRNQNKIY
jgi:hypothetical protein